MSLPEPITWQALQVVKGLIQQITVANGFHTDIGAGLILTDRSRLRLDAGAVTLIVAGDVDEDEESSSRRISATSMDLSVEFAVPFDDENPEQLAHRARADIVRALKTDLRGSPVKFRDLQITSSRFLSDADEQGIPFTLAQVTARAGLTETHAPAQ